MKRYFLLCVSLLAFLPLVAQPSHEGIRDSVRMDSVSSSLPYYLSRPGWRGYDWNFMPIHEGMNASVSLSATVGLGGHHPSGVGFGRDVDIVYASPFNKNLSYTFGVNTSNMDWGGYHFNQAGLGGSLSYRVNDKISFSVAGYKNLVRPKSFFYNEQDEFFRNDSYVNGAVNMKFNDNIFLQVSFGTATFKP